MADTETGVVNGENIYDRWEELCTDLIDDKAGYFEDKAHDAVAEAFSCPDGHLCPAMPLTDDELQELINCYSTAIVEYAKGLCSAPSPPRDNEVFGMDDPSPIMGIGSYLVDDSQRRAPSFDMAGPNGPNSPGQGPHSRPLPYKQRL